MRIRSFLSEAANDNITCYQYAISFYEPQPNLLNNLFDYRVENIAKGLSREMGTEMALLIENTNSLLKLLVFIYSEENDKVEERIEYVEEKGDFKC